MKRFLGAISIGALIIFSVSSCGSSGGGSATLLSSPESSSYRLGPGDQIELKVLGGDELKGQYTVQYDGTISLMLIGKIPAAGLTVDDLEKEIARRLAAGRYITHPEVGVSVVSYRPFYILGEVVKPGAYPYASGMRVLSAVAAAQGYTYRANQDYVIITRNGKEGKGLGLTPIQPDDIIQVPERYF
jgi:protein involved in polysaccharide export with SLBB domain